jgi:hypothetical protein
LLYKLIPRDETPNKPRPKRNLKVFMKSDSKLKKIFIPFTHQNLDLKNGLIGYARELGSKQGFENQVAAAFIYISFAEYLADHLLENLRHFIYKGSYNQFAGILFIDESGKEEKLTLGQIISKLKKYNFPDKEGVLDVLDEVCKARNNIFHNFANTDASGLEKIMSVDLITIEQKSEELLDKINVIYAGLQKILLPQAENTSGNNNGEKGGE